MLRVHSYIQQGSQRQKCTSTIPKTQRVSSKIASVQRYCCSTAACTHRQSKHRKYTASQLKCCEYTAIYSKDRKYRSAHQASQINSESAQILRVHSDIAVVQLLAHIAHPANTQRVGSDVATQIIDLEARSADGEELGCEPSQADSDTDNRHKAADGAP